MFITIMLLTHVHMKIDQSGRAVWKNSPQLKTVIFYQIQTRLAIMCKHLAMNFFMKCSVFIGTNHFKMTNSFYRDIAISYLSIPVQDSNTQSSIWQLKSDHKA